MSDSFDIEKFAKAFDIQVKISAESDSIVLGKHNVCFLTTVTRKEKLELEFISCFTKGNSGKVIFTDGNLLHNVEDGIFAYIGDRKAVYNYFEKLTKIYAKEYFQKYDSNADFY